MACPDLNFLFDNSRDPRGWANLSRNAHRTDPSLEQAAKGVRHSERMLVGTSRPLAALVCDAQDTPRQPWSDQRGKDPPRAQSSDMNCSLHEVVCRGTHPARLTTLTSIHNKLLVQCNLFVLFVKTVIMVYLCC